MNSKYGVLHDNTSAWLYITHQANSTQRIKIRGQAKTILHNADCDNKDESNIFVLSVVLVVKN
jgi:hypothetical protein